MIQGSLSKMDGMEAARGLYGMDPKNNAFLGAIVQSYNFIVGAGAIPSRLFLRKNLGERAFSPFAFLLCVAFYFSCFFIPPFDGDSIPVLVIIGFGGVAFALNVLDPESINIYLLVLFGALLNSCLWFIIWLIRNGIKHFKIVAQNAKENKIQYSYYRGEGKYFEHRIGGKKWGYDIDEMFVRMVIEPLAVFKWGAIIFFSAVLLSIGIFSWGLEENRQLAYAFASLGWLINVGLMIMFSGFCLFLEEFGIMTRIRGAALDLIDGEYDMVFVMKKKEELLAGRDTSADNIKMAEEIYQSSFGLATMPGMTTNQSLTKPEEPEVSPHSSELNSLREKLLDQFLTKKEG